jgi:hypothetical protein
MLLGGGSREYGRKITTIVRRIYADGKRREIQL